jgi:hypothetical protein
VQHYCLIALLRTTLRDKIGAKVVRAEASIMKK